MDPKKQEMTLIDEIISNARRDRKRLEAVADGLTHGFDSHDSDESMDPEVSAAFAEEIAKISDSLTRSNQQLIELVKLDIKRGADKNASGESTKLSKKEAESMYDEIAKPKEEELN